MDQILAVFVGVFSWLGVASTTFFNAIVAAFGHIPFSGPTWFVIAIAGFFVWLFAKAHKNVDSPVRWEDLMIDHSNNKVSPYKMGYLIGVMVSTYVVILFADKAITTSMESFTAIFVIYLTFVTTGALNNSWVKRGQQNTDDDKSSK